MNEAGGDQVSEKGVGFSAKGKGTGGIFRGAIIAICGIKNGHCRQHPFLKIWQRVIIVVLSLQEQEGQEQCFAT